MIPRKHNGKESGKPMGQIDSQTDGRMDCGSDEQIQKTALLPFGFTNRQGTKT